MTQQSPSIGRIVHYVIPDGYRNAGETRPAILVRIWNDMDHPTNPGMSNILVFTDGSNDSAAGHALAVPEWTGSVSFSAERTPGTWHWPPFVPPKAKTGAAT